MAVCQNGKQTGSCCFLEIFAMTVLKKPAPPEVKVRSQMKLPGL